MPPRKGRLAPNGNSCAVPSLDSSTQFEGEGDALLEWDGSRLWAGHGVRTLHCTHQWLADIWGVEVVSLRLVDPRFYRVDTCFCPLFRGYVMYFLQAFDAESLTKIETRHQQGKRIQVGDSDALRFACNAVNAGRVIILNQVSVDLANRLEDVGFCVVQVPLTEFLKAGGAAKCLALRLSQMDVTHTTAASPSLPWETADAWGHGA